MPGVVGCVDGTLVRITRPIECIDHEKSYVNSKNYHSINVQVGNRSNFIFICSNFIVSLNGICDANCRFVNKYYQTVATIQQFLNRVQLVWSLQVDFNILFIDIHFFICCYILPLLSYLWNVKNKLAQRKKDTLHTNGTFGKCSSFRLG